MKRFFNVLLIVLAGLFAFVACSPQASFSDELVNVSIEGSSQKTGRALIVETDFDISKVKVWKYTAAKADSGLDTGATTERVALVKDESGNWMTKSLSQGSWNFVLYGYSDDAGSTLVCSGSVDNQTITVANHNVKITVRPSQTATGNIVIEDDIKIVKKDGTEYSGDEYTKTVKVTNASGTDVTTQLSSVKSGRYKVEVVFKGTANGEEYTAAKAFKYINVYDNLTTTVSGTIEEIEQAGNVDPEGGMIKAEAEATVTVEEQKNKEAVEIAVASTPAGTTDEKKTTVKFPAKSVSMETDSTKLTLKVESSSIQAASTSYTVETEEGAPVAGFKFTLEGAESTTFDTEDGVEVETYIETGLGDVGNIKIKYIGSSDGKAPEIVSYDSTTGKLVFKVYHFSTYVILAENAAAVDNNGKIYTTLKEALISDASEITVFQNSELTEAITIGSGKIVNLNGKTINLNVTGDAINLPASDKAYTVEFIDGKITGQASNICFTVSNNGTLVLRNMDMKTTCLAGIFLVQGAHPANFEVIDSVIDVTGGYGIGTNASITTPATYVEITIDNSAVTVKSSDQDNTALFVNVDAKVSVTGSTISGQRQGAILRGTGTNEVTIANSTIEAVGNGNNYADRSTTWSSGNEVALAALVIGNSPNTNAGYERPTTVKLDNVILNIADDYKGKHIWAVQQSDDYKVKVSGDINGDWTVNENINGAEYPLAKIGEKYYSTLHSAVLAAQTGETVNLLCDASGSGLESEDASGDAVGTRGDITIDFGGHTYTVTHTSVGSTNTETQAMHWGRSIKSITMKNGKFTTTQFDTLKMGMQNYVDFTAENMTFDMSNVLVVKFGENEFSGNNAIYNGQEVAIFNNNKGAMKLTKCTVTLPESSKMGMSADGDSVTLVETTVNGAVNMQDSTSKLTIDSKSKITKGVVAYFGEKYDVVESTAESSTTYTLKAKSTT